MVRRRIDELGTREASIQRQGADRILVQVPGEKDPENIKRLLGQTARLTFHMVDLECSVQDALKGRVPPGDMLLESTEREGRGLQHYLVKRQVELSGENLTDAQPILPGQPAGRQLPASTMRAPASSARSPRRTSASRSRSCSTTR